MWNETECSEQQPDDMAILVAWFACYNESVKLKEYAYVSREYIRTTFRKETAQLKLGFHIRGKRKRLAAAASGCGMRYANDLIPYIRLPMRLHSLFLSE